MARVFLKSWLMLLGYLALPAGAAELMPITVSVPGPGAASYLPVELISKIGADRAEGAEVRVKFAPGGGVAIEELLTNNADFAVIGLPAAMSARLKDKRVIALAAVNDLPLYVLLVRQGLSGKVKTAADLRGRVVGVHSNSLSSKTNSHQLLELILRRSGIGPDDVRVVSVGQRWQSEDAMLATASADAIMGDEPHATRMIANKTAYSLMHLGEPGVAEKVPGGGFLRGSLIGRSDLVERDAKKYETMVRIVRRTLQWMATHSPAEIVDMAGISDPEVKGHFLAVLKKYPRQYSPDGKFSTRQLQQTEQFFRESQADNPAARALAVESMVVDRFAGRKD